MAAPHNSARSLRQDFCSNSKFRKWRNTVCISHFRNCGSGAKRRLRLADAIARCCLRFYHLFTYIPCAPWFSCMLVLKLFWLEIGHISFDIIVSLHNGNNVLRWMPHSSRVYLKTVNTPKQRVFSACCAPFSLAIHKVFPRKNGFIRRKIPRCWSYCRFSDRP